MISKRGTKPYPLARAWSADGNDERVFIVLEVYKPEREFEKVLVKDLSEIDRDLRSMEGAVWAESTAFTYDNFPLGSRVVAAAARHNEERLVEGFVNLFQTDVEYYGGDVIGRIREHYHILRECPDPSTCRVLRDNAEIEM